jgi:hypothetical protein
MGRSNVPHGLTLKPSSLQLEAACILFGVGDKFRSFIVIAILSPGSKYVEFTERSRRIPKEGLLSDTRLFGVAARGKTGLPWYAKERGMATTVAIAR